MTALFYGGAMLRRRDSGRREIPCRRGAPHDDCTWRDRPACKGAERVHCWQGAVSN